MLFVHKRVPVFTEHTCDLHVEFEMTLKMTLHCGKFPKTQDDNVQPVYRRIWQLSKQDYNYKVIQITDENRRIKMLLRATPKQQSNKPDVQIRLTGLKRKASGLAQRLCTKKRPFISQSCNDSNTVKVVNGQGIRRKRPLVEKPPQSPSQPKRPCGVGTISRYCDKRVPPTGNSWLHELGLNAKDVEILDSGEWLTDDHISAAQKLLRRQFPALAGLQEPVLGEILEFQQMTSDGVQVMLNGGGGHWVTVCKTDGTVKLLDSENIGLSPKLSSQIVNLCTGREGEHRPMGLEVQLPKMHPQRGSSDCGVFALAYATEVAFGGHPESVVFDQRMMRNHFKSCLASLKMTPFPKMNCSPRTAKVIGIKSEILLN